ncbi:hypothetical protein BJX70DRAFT_215080 [Aspergillus crustosus]
MSEINYQDTIRFRTTISNATKYLTLAVVPAESGGTCYLTLTDTPSRDSNFLLREYNYHNFSRFHFSGNTSASTPDCHGNFRLLHLDTRPVGNVGDDFCVSMGPWKPMVNMGYWGVNWSAADDLETFTLFAVNWPQSDGGVVSGDPVKIRSMIGARNPSPVGSIGQILTVEEVDGEWRVLGVVHTYDEGVEWVVEKVDVEAEAGEEA